VKESFNSVERLLQKHQPAPAAESADLETEEDQGAYGIVRAPRERALMVELRKKDGTIMAVPYAMIEQLRFSPSNGITIHACGRELQIRGRNLNPTTSSRLGLFSGLCRHRVAWILESSRSASQAGGESAAQVEAISI
jgi:hypothetical protein